MIGLWTLLGSLAVVLGFWYLTGTLAVLNIFLVLGSVTLCGSFIWNLKIYQDWLNPLTLLLLSAFVRVALPAILLLSGNTPPWWAGINSIPTDYWISGLSLAMVGLLSIVIGWFLMPAVFKKIADGLVNSLDRLSIIPQYKIKTGASIYIFLGLVFIAVFMAANFGNPLEAITSGIIRGSENRVSGTSRYNFIGNWLLITGTLVLTTHLLIVQQAKWWYGLLPAFLGTLVFASFGGRVGALSYVIYGLTVLWYRQPNRRIRLRRDLTIGVLLSTIGAFYAEAILAYRGGGGIEALIQGLSWTGVIDYFLGLGFWYEMGMLHIYAMAILLGAGVLEGSTFPLMAGFIATLMFDYPLLRPGGYMVQRLINPSATWGFHTGLIVDLYMNTNLITMIIICVIFGAIVHAVYQSFLQRRQSVVINVFYAIFLWQGVIWVFYESITSIFSFVLGAFFLFTYFIAASLLPIKPPNARQFFRTARINQSKF